MLHCVFGVAEIMQILINLLTKILFFTVKNIKIIEFALLLSLFFKVKHVEILQYFIFSYLYIS